MNLTAEKLAKMIDHTLLKIDCTYRDIEKICYEALDYNFASVAVNPSNVKISKDILKNSNVKVCTAIGFYLGSYPCELKKFEIEDAIENGADELDMLINITAVKERQYNVITDEIESLVALADGRVTKVILENCYLNAEEITIVCQIAKELQADFVKTSTGFGPYGARVEHVKLMRKIAGNTMQVKAAGGIATLAAALDLVKA